MVFLLGKLGDNRRALMLIIERLGDVGRVRWFVIWLLFFLMSFNLSRLWSLPRSKTTRSCGRTCSSMPWTSHVKKLGGKEGKKYNLPASNTQKNRSFSIYYWDVGESWIVYQSREIDWAYTRRTWDSRTSERSSQNCEWLWHPNVIERRLRADSAEWHYSAVWTTVQDSPKGADNDM